MSCSDNTPLNPLLNRGEMLVPTTKMPKNQPDPKPKKQIHRPPKPPQTHQISKFTTKNVNRKILKGQNEPISPQPQGGYNIIKNL